MDFQDSKIFTILKNSKNCSEVLIKQSKNKNWVNCNWSRYYRNVQSHVGWSPEELSLMEGSLLPVWGLKLDGLQRDLPTQTVLWIYNFMIYKIWSRLKSDCLGGLKECSMNCKGSKLRSGLHLKLRNYIVSPVHLRCL